MRKLFLLSLLIVLLISCQKEQFKEENPTTENLLPKTLKSADEVFSFLATEMPEVYTAEEINRLKSMLDEPEEDFKRSGNTVELPAGSVDALQAAVEEAGPGGTVIVKTGLHVENNLVTIGHRINLMGEEDALIQLVDPLQLENYPVIIQGGIHVFNAPKSVIQGIHFTGGEAGACNGLFIENSAHTRVSDNQFTNIQFSIQVEQSNSVNIRNNLLVGNLDVLATVVGNIGITIINGKSCSIIGNTVSATFFGIWNCDRGGINWGNSTSNCFYGQILCKVPPSLQNPSGVVIGAADPGNHWLLALNESSDNFYGGIVAIDGSFDNTLLANKGSGNAAYDVDLVGPTERFGFFTPTSSGNRVWSFSDQVIKDCGENNRVTGGIQVDTNVDPCDNVETE